MKQTAFAVVLSLVAVACGSPQPSLDTPAAVGPPAPGGTVVIGLLSDIQSWNPYLSEDSATDNLLALVYPSLAVEQPDYHLHPPTFAPALAESWSWSEDHLELTLDLDPDARWSDGVPITSRDVVFSWQAQTSPESIGSSPPPRTTSLRWKRSIDHQVRVTYNRFYPYQFMDLNDGAHRARPRLGDDPLRRVGIDRLETTRRRRGPVQPRQTHSDSRRLSSSATPGTSAAVCPISTGWSSGSSPRTRVSSPNSSRASSTSSGQSRRRMSRESAATAISSW